MVTEVYIKENCKWKLSQLTFSHLLKSAKLFFKRYEPHRERENLRRSLELVEFVKRWAVQEQAVPGHQGRLRKRRAYLAIKK